METGEGIKNFRDRKRWKQADLAKELGIIQQNISIWEAGKGTPSFTMTKKLLELGITVEELFGVEYEEMHRDQVIKTTENAKLLELENNFKKMQAKFKELENMEKIKERYINRYFDVAKKCIEKKNIKENDLEKHFEMLTNHYDMLIDIGKELDSTDIERLNDLNSFILNKYKKEYFDDEGEFCYLRYNDFYEIFDQFVYYCYYKMKEENIEKKYFEKALEVMNNFYSKAYKDIYGDIKNENEYSSAYVSALEDEVEETKMLENLMLGSGDGGTR